MQLTAIESIATGIGAGLAGGDDPAIVQAVQALQDASAVLKGLLNGAAAKAAAAADEAARKAAMPSAPSPGSPKGAKCAGAVGAGGSNDMDCTFRSVEVPDDDDDEFWGEADLDERKRQREAMQKLEEWRVKRAKH